MSNEIAQRLRRFRRPAGVAEILKPSVRSRVSGWAFLAVVAVLAVTVGAGLTALSKTEFRRQGQMVDVLDSHELVVGDASEASSPAVLGVSGRQAIVDGVIVDLEGNVTADEESRLTFRFRDAATGEEITDLQPYLAAAGHVVVMAADGGDFAHEHAEVEDEQGRPVFALPGQQFGPELDVHVHVDDPGVYRLWGQFRLADETVITVPFTVEAH